MNWPTQLLNTTINKVKHVSLQHATSFNLCGEGMLGVPRSVILNGIISYGGSTGFGLNLTQRAFGEYYERNHFFTSVPINAQKKLSDITTPAHQHKLRLLCKQTDEEQLTNHRFSLTKVYNLFDESEADYFYNALSLNANKSDLAFLPGSDSCGCASHTTKERALYQSMIEFLERQSLIGSWLAKTYRYAVNPELLKELSPYNGLVAKLLENGTIYIFENGNYLPGYNVIMFFFAHSPDDAVQYSVGSKSAATLAAALVSALEELYQCYTFLYSAVFKPTNLENKAGAGYHLSFTQFNQQSTKLIIPFLERAQGIKINTLGELQALPRVSYAQMLEQIQQLTPYVYYYHHYEKALALHFTKIVSPDFFAHMSVNKMLNIENLYAKKLNITQENAYLEKLPFP